MKNDKANSNHEAQQLQGTRDIQTTDSFGAPVTLRPGVGLYEVRDFMGQTLPGLAVQLDLVGDDGELEPYATLTTSFGEFISIKNAAYIDINNCPFAESLLSQGIADPTGLYKTSGFCQYPLWVFREDFLREVGGEHYRIYSEAHDRYMRQMKAMLSMPEEEPIQEQSDTEGQYEWGAEDVRRAFAEKLDHVLPQHDVSTTTAWIKFAEEMASASETTFETEAESLLKAFQEISAQYSPKAVAEVYATIHAQGNALLASEIPAAAERAEQGMTSEQLSDLAARGVFHAGPTMNMGGPR